MGSHSLLQGIFLTKGLNMGLLHCRGILYCLSHQRSPFNFMGLVEPYLMVELYYMIERVSYLSSVSVGPGNWDIIGTD